MSGMRQRAVLVENEELSLARLRRLLQGFPQDIEIVGEAMDGPSAVAVLGAQRPDVVFLDIDLPGCDGFQVLGELEHQPSVIFTTAFREHAVDSFKTRVVDYLLKPIDADAVARSLTKLRAVGRSQRFPSRMRCREGGREVVLKIGEVLYFQADNKYTSVRTVSREFLIETPLIDLERKLDPESFLRIHRSTLVNIAWIAEIRRAYDGKLTVVLNDAKNTELPVSRMYADNLKAI